MSAGGDVYDLNDYARAAGIGRSTLGAGVLDFDGTSSTSGTSVGSPANRINSNMNGGAMTKTNLRVLAFYLAVGAVVTFAVAHLAPIRGR